MPYIRTKEGQAKHDRGVAVWARAVIRVGWKLVYSDLPGNALPPLVNGFRPDIYAKSGIQELVIEVETADSAGTLHAVTQKIAFRRWAVAMPNRSFLLKIV